MDRHKHDGFDRRSFLHGAAKGGALIWVVPTVLTLDVSPAAATPPPPASCPILPPTEWQPMGATDGVWEISWAGSGSLPVPGVWLASARQMASDGLQPGDVPEVRVFARGTDGFLAMQLSTNGPALCLEAFAAQPPAGLESPDLVLVQRSIATPLADGSAVSVATTSILSPDQAPEATPLTPTASKCDESCLIANVLAGAASAAFCAPVGSLGCGNPFSFLTCGVAALACGTFTGAALAAAHRHCDACKGVEQCIPG